MAGVQSESGLLVGDPRMLIDGDLVHAADDAMFEVIHPGTGEVAGRAYDGTIADMQRAVVGARRAFDNSDWSRDVEFRYHCLMQLHDALQAHKERLRRIVVTEAGCPISLTIPQIDDPIAEIAHWAEYGRSFEYLHDVGVHQSPLGPTRRFIHYDPIGVVAAVTPWNLPFYLNVSESVPALIAGNAVVLKPAQLTPWSGSELGRIVAEETDIPPGVFNVVVSNANEVGAALCGDPRVDMIVFTGSTATGRSILSAAAPTVKKTVLELGGKSAHILLDDADFGDRLPMAAMMACAMSGQTCTLPSRIILPRSRYDEGLQILKATMEVVPIGDPWDPGVIQGPQISETQRHKVLGLIASGIDDGARIVTGGGIPGNQSAGYFVEPTLLADVDPKSDVAQQEIFGPVLTAIAYDSEDEAIGIANDSIYGLSGEVSSADTDRALSVAQRMRTGTVTVNGGSFFGITTPFGGTKQSGLGRRYGDEGFKEYLEVKTIGLPS